MLRLPESVRIYLATGRTDMRKGFDGLSGLVEHELGEDVYSGHLFVFLSRRGDRVKVLTRAKLQTEEVEHPVPDGERTCPNCPGVLRPMPAERTVEYDYVPAKIIRRVHLLVGLTPGNIEAMALSRINEMPQLPAADLGSSESGITMVVVPGTVRAGRVHG